MAAEAIGLGASLVGIMAAAAKITSLTVALYDDIKDAPDHFRHIEAEVVLLAKAVAAVQRLVQREESRQGSDTDGDSEDPLVPPESLLLAVTRIVLTFSKLESLLTDLVREQTAINRLTRRMRMLLRAGESKTLLRRLQLEKTTMILFLQITTCDQDDERRLKITAMDGKLNEVLSRSRDMSGRAWSLVESRTTSSRHAPSTYAESSHGSISTIRTFATARSRVASLYSIVQFSFESLLLKSTPYLRSGSDELLDFTSDLSHLTSGTIKQFRSVSLCRISTMSMFALPLFMAELTNAYHYDSFEPADSLSIKSGKPSKQRSQLDFTYANYLAAYRRIDDQMSPLCDKEVYLLKLAREGRLRVPSGFRDQDFEAWVAWKKWEGIFDGSQNITEDIQAITRDEKDADEAEQAEEYMDWRHFTTFSGNEVYRTPGNMTWFVFLLRARVCGSSTPSPIRLRLSTCMHCFYYNRMEHCLTGKQWSLDSFIDDTLARKTLRRDLERNLGVPTTIFESKDVDRILSMKPATMNVTDSWFLCEFVRRIQTKGCVFEGEGRSVEHYHGHCEELQKRVTSTGRLVGARCDFYGSGMDSIAEPRERNTYSGPALNSKGKGIQKRVRFVELA